MRRAILSDIHGNIEALEAVFRDIAVRNDQGARIDEVLCLGDIVGYGPNPRECIGRVRNDCRIALSGNHELGVVRKIDNPGLGLNRATGFSGTGAREGILWTIQQIYHDDSPVRPDDTYVQNLLADYRSGEFERRRVDDLCGRLHLNSDLRLSFTQRLVRAETELTRRVVERLLLDPESRTLLEEFHREFRRRQEASEAVTFLSSLPTSARLDNALLVHDNPLSPGDGRYVLDDEARARLKPSAPVHSIEKVFVAFDWKDADFVFFGHSHFPGVYECNGRVLANPGSVGMPRGAKMEASYLIWDAGSKKGKSTIEIARLPLQTWRTTGEKMERAGLPNKLKALVEQTAAELD